MRGLTIEERRFMLSDGEVRDAWDPLLVGLERRGLLREGPCAGGNEYEMIITPVGELALRLDAAARAFSSVPA